MHVPCASLSETSLTGKHGHIYTTTWKSKAGVHAALIGMWVIGVRCWFGRSTTIGCPAHRTEDLIYPGEVHQLRLRQGFQKSIWRICCSAKACCVRASSYNDVLKRRLTMTHQNQKVFEFPTKKREPSREEHQATVSHAGASLTGGTRRAWLF